MEAMNLIAPQIQQSGASLVAISPQTVKQSYFMYDQHKLRFPLLSDAGKFRRSQFGIVYKAPEYQQLLYKRVFINLPHANGDQSWELPIPATFMLIVMAQWCIHPPMRTIPRGLSRARF
jgi:peroxiredoxin